MTVRELAEKLNLKILAGHEGLERVVTGCYICDLLSWVISHSMKGNAWITIHTHLNIVAVALLVELSCVIIPENIIVDDATLKKAEEENLPILSSNMTSFEVSCSIEKAGIANA